MGGGGGGGEVDPWAGPVESLAELDLGEKAPGFPTNFPIPDRTLGLTTLSESSTSFGIGIASLKPPAQSSVIFNFAIPGQAFDNFVGIGALSGANPQSDLPQAFPIAEGSWQLRLAADEGLDSVRSRVFVRRTLDGNFHGGVLDVHVLIAPGSGASQSYMNGVLSDLFDDYYEPLLGISQGTVTFGTLPSSATFVTSHNAYRSLLATSSTSASAPAINLFVVGEFQGDLQGALGVAGGIPGSPMVHGTPTSGVAYTPTGDQGYDASVLAHEIGHLGGLFHTSEYQLSAFDPLGDTPQCNNIQNMDPNNCPDVTNVMFPIAYGGYQLSASQVRVLRGSALYRGILESGGQASPPLHPVVAPSSPSFEPSAFNLPATHAPVLSASATRLERVLYGHWCGTSGDVGATVLANLVEEDRPVLEGLATDPEAFDVARGRALSLLAKSADDAGDADVIVDLAASLLADPESGRQLQLAAIDAIARLSPGELEGAVTGTDVRVDPVIVSRLAQLSL